MNKPTSDIRTFARDNSMLLIIVILISLIAGIIGGYAGTRISLSPLSTNTDGNTGGLIFSVASSTGDPYFVVGDNGKVGVNTIYPKTNLDITGTLRAWWAFVPPCTTDIEGAFSYDRTTHHFVGCNGQQWLILDNGNGQ